MATVNIKLTQDTVDLQHDGFQIPALYTTLGVVADAAVALEDELALADVVSWSLSGTTLRTTLDDGATVTYTGFTRANAKLATGAATATGIQFQQKNMMTFSATGTLHLDYAFTPVDGKATPALAVGAADVGWNVGTLRVSTSLGADDAAYVAALGNVAASLKGDLLLTPDGALSGSVTQMTASSKNYLAAQTIDGALNVHLDGSPASLDDIGGSVSGAITGYSEFYVGGGSVKVADGLGVIDAARLVDDWAGAAYLGGKDDITVDLPGLLYDPFIVSAGAGDDRISVRGGGGDLHVAAGSGDDTVVLLGDEHTVDGGAGLDTVQLQGPRADFQVHRMEQHDPLALDATGPVFTVTSKDGTVDTLVNVERLVFADATLALDIDGNAGAIYRLYQAALNRQPDAGGLGFWIDAIDHGVSLHDIAESFLESAEFRGTYGAAQSTMQLLTLFYNNVLHRAPDTGGLNFWANVIDSKLAGVADVLASISESPENKAALIGVIGDGFAYAPYLHG